MSWGEECTTERVTRWARMVVAAVLVAAGPLVLGAQTAADTATDATADSEAGASGQLFVPDVESQFGALSLRPDGLAFDISGSPDPELCKHYQGMARVQGPDGTPYLFVSRSGNEPNGPAAWGCSDSDDPGNLLIVRMGSRDRSTERMRSNRLARDSQLTPPDSRDGTVRTITFDGTGDWPAYGHPGGMQLLGDVLAVALEGPYEGGADNVILFLDVSDPEAPTIASTFEPPPICVDVQQPDGTALEVCDAEFSAGVVGITEIRAPDGSCCRYLLVVIGKENKDLRVFRSLPTDGGTTSDLASGDLDWEPVGRYSEGEIEDCLGTVPGPFGPIAIDWHTGPGDAHQMLNFVRQGHLDGALYLVGGRNTTALPSGADKVDLYRVHLDASGTPAPCFLTHADTLHLTSHPYIGGGDSANFAAASGVHVSASGELIVYAAEFENDGPVSPVSGRRTVRFGEYRHRDVVRDDSPTLHPTAELDGPFVVDEGSQLALTGRGAAAATKAWIQLYEDDGAGELPNFVEGDDGNTWVAVDYIDRNRDDFDDLSEIDFGNEAGSWRWWAPPGCDIHANDFAVDDDPDAGPDSRVLRGDGVVHVVDDLDSISFNDDLGSVAFDEACTTYYGATIGLDWDLDDDGSYEAEGSSVDFDAGTLDGPTTRRVVARAAHPDDTSSFGFGTPVHAPVTVRNVAPEVSSSAIKDSAGNVMGSEALGTLLGLPVTLDVTFTDPGIADTQTAVIDWGDGTVDTSFDLYSDASGGAIGRLSHDHTYGAAGTYSAEVRITDDDGGHTVRGFEVVVFTPAQAIESVVDALDQRIAAATAPDVITALEQARDELVGNLGGHPPTNGALDHLEDDDLLSAITKLGAALGHLVAAGDAGAGDLSGISDLLTLVAESIAVATHAEAVEATDPPNRGQARNLADIDELIAEGHQLLIDGLHADACKLFRRAVEDALKLTNRP